MPDVTIPDLPDGSSVSGVEFPGSDGSATRRYTAAEIVVGGLASTTPAAVGTAAVGVGTTAARADHVHAHGNQAGGALHADVVAGGASGFMTGAQATKLDGIEANADVTDAANVDAAGAVMESDFTTTHAILVRQGGSSPTAVAIPLSSFVGRIASGDVIAMTVTEAKTLLALAGTDVSFSPTGTPLVATTVQAAIVEVESRSRARTFVDSYLSGRYYALGADEHPNGLATIQGFADRIDLCAFIPRNTLTPTELGCYVTALIASAEFKILVYDSDGSGGAPGTRLYASGAIAASASAWLPATTGLPTFTAGRLYWIGVVHSSTATLRALPLTSILAFGGLGTASPPSGATIGSVIRRTTAGNFASPPASWGTLLSTEITNGNTPPALIALAP